MPCRFYKNTRGFSLLEVVVATGVFLLFAVGIYSGTEFVYKVVYQSRVRIIETSILNEQIELIRNLPFEEVGIPGGSPSGVLDRTISITRNGIDFTLTRTIRNIDDPYDGTIGGNPNDTAPADYKLIDVEIICDRCGQRAPLVMATRVAPKYLEGDPDHGALFIEVFDANAAPVVGASVHIVATSTDPAVDFIDETDNDGMLRIVDLGNGVGAYHITVSKDGYTSDQTITPSGSNPNPVKPPVSVVAQDVTSISFTIDRVSSLQFETQNVSCAPVELVDFHLSGTSLLGTDPDVFKVNTDRSTDGSGMNTLGQINWDSYGIQLENYDLIGTIPALPIVLPPGVDQRVGIIVGPNTGNSLVVSVEDSTTSQPLSSSTVRVFGQGEDETKSTGLGFVRQNTWIGGAGQTMFTNDDEYFSDDGGVDATSLPGNITLDQNNGNYTPNGSLESSIFDLGTASNLVNLTWEPFSQGEETGDESVRFQIATDSIADPETWEYLGPDGTTATYYSDNNITIHESHDGDRFFRYKMFLQTASTTFTPTISDVLMTYTTECTPPGQAYFGALPTGAYTVEVTREGYQSASETINVDGDMVFTIDMVADN